MAKKYRWQVALSANGPIAAGILSGDTAPHDSEVLTGSASASFYYLDSNVVSSGTANTSRVVINTVDAWEVSIDSSNNVSVALTTLVPSIVRDNVNGNPAGASNYARSMSIHRYDGGGALWEYLDTNISQAKTIATDLDLGTQRFILPPGESASSHSIFVFNKTVGVASPGDRLNMGIKITNILPKDYRPGAILDGVLVWQSHNREGGEAHVLTANGTWREMRTLGSPTEKGNPPSIRKDNSWFNQAKIGKE